MLCHSLSQLSGNPASLYRRSIRARARPFSTSAVLERSASGVKDFRVVNAPEFDLLTSTQEFDKAFYEYKSATRKMEDLERLSAELLSNLQELNSAADALDAMPIPMFEPENQEARRAKRAAAREARKTQASATTTVVKRAPAPETNTQPAPLQMGRQRFESMLQQAPAPRPSSSVSLLSSGLSLMSVPASSGLQAEPSARARQANAKRARLSQGRREPVAASAISDASKLGAHSGTSDGTSQFMKKAASLDLLNGVSEKELAIIVKDLLFLEKLKKDMHMMLKREPTISEWATAVSMDVKTFTMRLSVGKQAKSTMLQANHRLVISVCKKYQNKGIALQDLITEGVQGLLRGVEKFDPDKGFRFSTYAHWWIRQAVTRSLSDQGRTVRLPTNVYEQLARVTTTKAVMTEELGREPSIPELSQRLKTTAEKIRELYRISQPTSSLDVPVGEDDGMASAKDMIEDERATPDGALDDLMLKKDVANILSQLSEREAGIIKLRFGLENGREMTLEDIGAHFKVTRERIRQIEAKAVRKLKQRQKELASILKEYSASAAEVEIAGRNSQGTNKSK